MNAAELDRFHAKTIPDDFGACVLWTARRDEKGYGRFWYEKSMRRAHRVAYQHWVGPIPNGLVIDHLCRNRACVNPWHLRPMTSAENTHAAGSEARSAKHATATHCVQGHAFDEANTYIYPKTGYRGCRRCNAPTGRRAGKAS